MRTYGADPEEPEPSVLFVGVSEYEVVADGTTLVAPGLGACVGLAVYDPAAGVGGLARAMLPRRSDGTSTSDGKYVDAAIEAMLRDAVAAGADYAGVEGYVVGGGSLLDLDALPGAVGEENVAVAREEFAALDVTVEGAAVGGSRGRTVEFDTGTGELRVETAHDAEATLLRTPD